MFGPENVTVLGPATVTAAALAPLLVMKEDEPKVIPALAATRTSSLADEEGATPIAVPLPPMVKVPDPAFRMVFTFSKTIAVLPF